MAEQILLNVNSNAVKDCGNVVYGKSKIFCALTASVFLS